MSRTYVVLEVSPAAYAEIRDKLLAAGYGHALHHEDGAEVVDMHGIALASDTAFSGTFGGVSDKQAERNAEVRAMLADAPEMTSEQRERQRESFARGNVMAGEPVT